MENSSNRPLAVVMGASSGIGHELAKQFAQNGFDLLVTSTGSSIDQATQEFEKLGTKVETVQADLATYDGVETLYSQIKSIGRPVDAKRSVPKTIHALSHSHRRSARAAAMKPYPSAGAKP